LKRMSMFCRLSDIATAGVGAVRRRSILIAAVVAALAVAIPVSPAVSTPLRENALAQALLDEAQSAEAALQAAQQSATAAAKRAEGVFTGRGSYDAWLQAVKDQQTAQNKLDTARQEAAAAWKAFQAARSVGAAEAGAAGKGAIGKLIGVIA